MQGYLIFWGVLAEYTHPFEYLWLRRDNPSGLLELNQLIVAWMALFGQDRRRFDSGHDLAATQ